MSGLGARWDGERLFYAGGDSRVYALVPGEGKAEPLPEVRLAEKTRSFAVAPAGLARGFAAKAKLFVLVGDTVEGFGADGKPAGTLLTLTRPAGASWWYCAVGLEPTTGDLLVGSYWPDSKVCRFDASGRQVERDGWPRTGHASFLTTIAGQAWMVEQGGVARPLPLVQGRDASGPCFGGVGTMYPSGLARDASGAFWLATSQGLLRFDRKGRPTGERLGGLDGVRALALASDGTLIAAVENGQRMIRLSLDDGPDAAFPSNSNEPWRVANGWSNRACALAWDARRFLVADEVGKQLWHFDPWHTGWKETPWLKLTEPRAFEAPRGVAAGDTLAWVLDAAGIREARAGEAPKPVSLPGLPDAGQVTRLAAWGDDLLLAALPDRVLAFRRAGDGAYESVWEAPGLKGVGGLVATGEYVAVTEREARALLLLDPRTGRLLARIEAAAVPGGMLPGAVTALGPWAVVADDEGKRLLRFRVVR